MTPIPTVLTFATRYIEAGLDSPEARAIFDEARAAGLAEAVFAELERQIAAAKAELDATEAEMAMRFGPRQGWDAIDADVASRDRTSQ